MNLKSDRIIGAVPTAIGACRVELRDGALVALHILPETATPEAEPSSADFRAVADAVNRYASGDLDAIASLPLAPEGTPFQLAVWEALRRIPAGQPVSYTRLAELCGRPTGVRAVASAVAANQIALAIPCHRVVPKGGGVGEFRWGPSLKAKLLELERSASRASVAA